MQVVFKIVPLEGSLLVNGEVQKRSEEILAEVAIALTLSRLRDVKGLAFVAYMYQCTGSVCEVLQNSQQLLCNGLHLLQPDQQHFQSIMHVTAIVCAPPACFLGPTLHPKLPLQEQI